MKQVIIQFFPPNKDVNGNMPYESSNSLGYISNICTSLSKSDENTSVFGQYCLLLDLSTELHILSRLVVHAEKGGVSYRIAYLENEVKWDSFSPKGQ